MKSCEEYRELISAYYDYELDRTTRMEVEAHVESCAQCAEVFRQYGEICPLDKGAMPSSVVQPVMERINAYETETDPFDKQGGEGARKQHKPMSKTTKTWLTIAACLLLLVTSVLFNQGPVSEYQMYQDSAGFDEAASSSMTSAGSAMEDGHGAAENDVASASSSAASTSSAAQPLLAALTDAQQVRVSLMDTDIIITDSESIAQLRQFLESQPAQVVADVSKADEIGTIELVPDAGLDVSITEDYRIVYTDGAQSYSIQPDAAALEDALHKLSQ